MIDKLFFLALLIIPMTSITGLPFLGEIQHEASAYVFLVIMALSAAPVLVHFRIAGVQTRERIFALPTIMTLMLCVIALSFVPNFITIKDSYFLGRGGLEKFASATILVLYGFGVSFLTYFIAERRGWDHLIVKPLAWSVVICAVFSFFELAARYSGAMSGLFQIISAPFYGDIPILEWDMRLRSLAFEPPDFANTAGYIWPWLLAALMATRGAKQAIFIALFILLNIMIILSEARTSLVVITGLVSVFLLLRFVFLPARQEGHPEKLVAPVSALFALFIPAGIAIIAYYFDDMVFAVVSEDNISNLSRLASMTAAMRMFEASPFYGFGFGQFGFHAAQYMPAWGFYSWEIQTWLFGPIGYWPAVYSVYARFAADMGIPGVLFWLSLWLWLARAVLVETLHYRERTGEVPFAAYPLILSCFGVLLAGIPCDSIRAPMIWVTLGLTCRYLATMRQARLLAAQTGAS